MDFVRSQLFPNVPLTSCTLFHHFEVPKSDEKVFNWLGLHSKRSDFLQNPYFRKESRWSTFGQILELCDRSCDLSQAKKKGTAVDCYINLYIHSK